MCVYMCVSTYDREPTVAQHTGLFCDSDALAAVLLPCYSTNISIIHEGTVRCTQREERREKERYACMIVCALKYVILCVCIYILCGYIW